MCTGKLVNYAQTVRERVPPPPLLLPRSPAGASPVATLLNARSSAPLANDSAWIPLLLLGSLDRRGALHAAPPSCDTKV